MTTDWNRQEGNPRVPRKQVYSKCPQNREDSSCSSSIFWVRLNLTLLVWCVFALCVTWCKCRNWVSGNRACVSVCQDFYTLQLFMRGCMRGMLSCLWITPTQNSFVGNKKSFWILRPPQHRSAACHLINHHGGGIR